MQERKDAFPSLRKPNSSVGAKSHTAEFQNSHFQVCRVTETTFPMHPVLFSTVQDASREQRVLRRNSRPPPPHRSHGMCSSAPQAGALEKQPNPHLEENLPFHKPAFSKTEKLPPRWSGAAEEPFFPACAGDLYLGAGVWQ